MRLMVNYFTYVGMLENLCSFCALEKNAFIRVMLSLLNYIHSNYIYNKRVYLKLH